MQGISPASLRSSITLIVFGKTLKFHTSLSNAKSDLISIDSVAARMATQFFVEEAWVRSNEGFPLYDVLKELALK